MARQSRRHLCLGVSGNATNRLRVVSKPKRSCRHVGLRRPIALACAIVATVQIVSLVPAHAQTNWTGNTSSDWFTGSNWLGGAIPTPAADAFLDTIVPNPTVINAPGAQALDVGGWRHVSGAGATWTNSGDLYIGRNGTGTLKIGSGTMSNEVGHVGGCDGCGTSAFGTVTVSGAGATWTNSRRAGYWRLQHGAAYDCQWR